MESNKSRKCYNLQQRGKVQYIAAVKKLLSSVGAVSTIFTEIVFLLVSLSGKQQSC